MSKSRISKELDLIKQEYEEEKVVRPFRELIDYGNKKLGRDICGYDIAIFNLGSATNCAGHKSGQCKVRDICYALKMEKIFKNIQPFREAQLQYWNTHSADEFVKDLVLTLYKENRKVKALRFNESGDIRNLNDLLKIYDIAEQLKFPVYLYTSRKDIIDNLQFSSDIKVKHILDNKNLIINGSGFMVHNEFRIINSQEEAKIDKVHKICNGNCSVCNLCIVKGSKIIQIIKH